MYPLVLGVVALISALALGVTYSAVKARIAEQEQKVLEEALKVALPEAEEFATLGYVAKDWKEAYHVLESAEEFERDRAAKGYLSLNVVRKGLRDGEVVGYVAEGARRGYSSLIRVAVGVDPGLTKVVAIKVISQQETPGLGARVDEIKTSSTLWAAILGRIPKGERSSVPWFQQNFCGVGVERLLSLTSLKGEDINGDGQPDAITGATISSDAVIGAVQRAIRQIMSVVSEGSGEAPPGDAPEVRGADAVSRPTPAGEEVVRESRERNAEEGVS